MNELRSIEDLGKILGKCCVECEDLEWGGIYNRIKKEWGIIKVGCSFSNIHI